MIRTRSLMLLALTFALPSLAVPKDASAESKKQKKEREKKEKEEKEKADAEAAAAAEAQAAADAAAAEKAAAEAAAAPPEPAPAEPAPVVEASVEGATAGSWSQRVIDRPLNLLAGMIRVDAALGVAKLTITTPGIPPAPDTTTTATGVGLGVGVGYGVSDKLEAGVSYGISLKEFEAKGPLRLYGLFNLAHSEKMRLSAGASFGYNLGSKKVGIGAGLAFQYHLNDKMMVYMPPTHLQIGLDPTTAVLSLPVGFGFQATDNIFAAVETSLFDIGLKPSGSAFFGADRTPLTLLVSYSPSNKMDLGVSIGAPNIPDIADLFVFSAFARLYLGNVPTRGAAAAAVVTDPTTDAPPPME